MAILDKWTVDFTSNGVEQTVRLGVRLGELLQPGDCIGLIGEIGAGKTAIARGIGRGWGSADPVTSPTFTFVNQYPRLQDGRFLYHIDCYRLETAADLISIGFEDIVEAEGAFMIEWADRIEFWLPADRLSIRLTYVNEMRRQLRLTATATRSAALLDAFKQSAFGTTL